MFKLGDIVICIDDSNNTTTLEPHLNLKKYHRYKISQINIYYYYYNNTVSLIDINGSFMMSRFISMKEYRKQKLQKICSKQEM